MDEASILAKFDQLVQSGLVLYDDKQVIIEKIDEGLKVSQTRRVFEFCPFSRVLTDVLTVVDQDPFHPLLSPCKKADFSLTQTRTRQ